MIPLYTVGHSNGSLTDLLELLRMANIDCLVDVRSIPASVYNPQFNQETLKEFLQNNGICYLHFGKEFGAQRTDAIINGQVDFNMATSTESFKSGVERIKNGLNKGYTISFMCSEGDPLECHRFSFISKFFYDHNYTINHILRNKTIVSHKDLETKMIRTYLLEKRLEQTQGRLLPYSEKEQRNDAYILKNKDIGFKPKK